MKPRNEAKKLEIYEYIKRYIREYGVCPSTGEIADGVHCARSTAHKFLVRLEEEGYIEKYGRNQIVPRERVDAPDWIPVLGSIACGKPKIALEDIETYIPISHSFMGEGEYFGLIADGDSMTEAGIEDGDIVFIRRQDTAENGEIAAVLTENETGEGYRATLKRFYRDEESRKIRLHPENRYMEDIMTDEADIMGVAVAVWKRLK